MCTSCVAQGIVYVGGAAGALRVMATRPSARRLAQYRANLASSAAAEAGSTPDEATLSTGTPHL